MQYSHIVTASNMIEIFVFLLSLGLIIWKILFPVPEPILGVYSRAGNRGVFKQWLMYLVLRWRKQAAAAKKGKKEVGYGLKLTDDIDKLESVKVSFVIVFPCQLN